MVVTFACPRCQQTSSVEIVPAQTALACPKCQAELVAPSGAFEGEDLRQCLACPSHELFVRKDFPQRLGVTIVVLGFAASCVTWYFYLTYWTFAVLSATALVDLLLYRMMGSALVCYHCGAQYRGLSGLESRAPFDLATHERYRQQAARLKQQSSHSSSRDSVGLNR